MVDPRKTRYLYLMMAAFGAISMSVILFFILFRMQGIGEAIRTLGDILAPFVYGGVVAYLLRPLCNAYEKYFQALLPGKLKKIAPAVAVTLSLVTGILIVYTLIIMIAPQLYESILSLWSTIPGKVGELLEWAYATFEEETELVRLIEQGYSMMSKEVEAWVQEDLIPSVKDFVGGLGSSVMKVLKFLYNLLIGLIVSCYLLASRKKFAKQSVLLIKSAFSPRWAKLILDEIHFIDKMFGGFIDGKIVDSAIIGVLCYIGCLIFKFPNALLISTFIGITNVIPFFGPFIGAIPSTFLILIEDPLKALWFGLFILGLQQLDGNVIGPKILGDRTGISSFWVLFTIILFGGLFGVVGMIIGVPLFAVIYDLVKKMVRRGLFRKNQIEVWEQYKAEYPDEEPPVA